MKSVRILFVITSTLVLISLVLAMYVNINWLWLTAFIAVGLLQAGLTGFCPMMKAINFILTTGEKSTGSIKSVDPQTLHKWLQNNEAILIDVREADEYKVAHIPGSILMPVGTCNAGKLPLNPDKKIVFHCKSGTRGGMACQQCVQGFEGHSLYNLDGGIENWIKQNFETQSSYEKGENP